MARTKHLATHPTVANTSHTIHPSNMTKVNVATEAQRTACREIITISDSPPVPMEKGKARPPATKSTVATNRVTSGRVNKLRGVFGRAAKFVGNQALAPTTPVDPLSKSAKATTASIVPAHSPTPDYVPPPKPRRSTPKYNTMRKTAAYGMPSATPTEVDAYNIWHFWPKDPKAYLAAKSESPERIKHEQSLMQCWNCCHCTKLRPGEEETRKWRYVLEKDMTGMLKCRACRHHCCHDCAIGGVEERDYQTNAVVKRHSGWALEIEGKK